MSAAFSPYLRTLAQGVADDTGIGLQQGVYAGVLGPSFETPAEVAALRSLGVSFTGMSTVNEVIMARALYMNVLGLTLATNMAGSADTNHGSVLACAERYSEDFERLVRGVLRML
jgi:purine-nucleoside phosphorylase